MKIRLLRHATLLLKVGEFNILVDPMLSEKYEMEPVAGAKDSVRIPMVDLPFGNRELMNIINGTDAVLVTHLHRDHWDARAAQLLRKTLPVFCQPGDEKKLQDSGFTNVQAVRQSLSWNGIKISLTGGHHGSGEIEKKMGKVSGFVLSAPGEPVLYIAGDTIWCAEVEDALNNFSPDVVVLNSGEAKFINGGPITMDSEGVKNTGKAARQATIIAVHFETVNHCMLKRSDLKKYLEIEGVGDNILIPEDGETLEV